MRLKFQWWRGQEHCNIQSKGLTLTGPEEKDKQNRKMGKDYEQAIQKKETGMANI